MNTQVNGGVGGGAEEPTTPQALSAVMSRFRTVTAEGAERLGASVELSPGQIAVLLAIDEGAGNVSAVAHQCLTHVSSSSRTIDTLVRNGLVDRSRDPADRRSVQLTLTDAGVDRVERVRDHRDRLTDVALAGMSADEQRQLVALLNRLMVGLERVILDDDPADIYA